MVVLKFFILLAPTSISKKQNQSIPITVQKTDEDHFSLLLEFVSEVWFFFLQVSHYLNYSSSIQYYFFIINPPFTSWAS